MTAGPSGEGLYRSPPTPQSEIERKHEKRGKNRIGFDVTTVLGASGATDRSRRFPSDWRARAGVAEEAKTPTNIDGAGRGVFRVTPRRNPINFIGRFDWWTGLGLVHVKTEARVLTNKPPCSPPLRSSRPAAEGGFFILSFSAGYFFFLSFVCNGQLIYCARRPPRPTPYERVL